MGLHPGDTQLPGAGRSRSPHATGLLLGLVLLIAAVALSLAVGTERIPPGDVWSGLFSPSGSRLDTIVRELRLPRTLIGIAVGTALGLAGGVMQVLTRNPLADPGLLGVNAGASAAVVTAISMFGITSFTGYLWFAPWRAPPSQPSPCTRWAAAARPPPSASRSPEPPSTRPCSAMSTACSCGT